MINKCHYTDCMEFMPTIQDKFFDLAIVDPPYGINIKTRIFCDNKNWDEKIPDKEYFDELFRVSKNQIIWGGNYFIEYLKNTSCFIIWDKKITDKHRQSMCEFAWTSLEYKSMVFYSPPPGLRGFYSIDGKRVHPTQKPIALYKWTLQNYAKPGWKILDTHEGSGSNRIACWDLGFYHIGCENDPDYWQQQEDRFKNHIANPELFEPETIQKHIYYNQGELSHE